MDTLKHKCAVFGVYGQDLEVARLTYFGLYALQHRGQESSGITVSNGKKISNHKSLGLVAQAYSEQDLKKLKGYIAIGHNRYSTSGGLHPKHIQPVLSKTNKVALAHNGNLPETKLLKKFLDSKKVATKGLNDSEMIQRAISFYVEQGESIEDAVKKSFPLFTGAFCLLVMTDNKLVAVRDAFGIRPLSLGKLNGGYVVSSETCAIDTVGAKFIRDVRPGEMLVISKSGLKSYQIEKGDLKLDIFELVYFARPDSIMLGKSVHEVRKNLGRELAREHKIKADVVIPVPESSIPAAIGYAAASGIPVDFGLVKNRYIGRTFITPGQRLRERGVQMKLNPVVDVVKGKRVIVIDDSVVRGTTLKKIVLMLKQAGAKKVHILSSCPPVLYPDFYGIDTPSQDELIASSNSTAQINAYLQSDSLGFLSYKGLIQATGMKEQVFCTSCFTGKYPIDIGDNVKNIKTPALRT